MTDPNPCPPHRWVSDFVYSKPIDDDIEIVKCDDCGVYRDPTK